MRNSQIAKTAAFEERFPNAIYFLSFQDYRICPFFTKSDVFLFEYLIMLAEQFVKKNGNLDFYHSYADFAKNGVLDKKTCKKSLRRFEDKLQIISTRVGTYRGNRSTRYTIHFDKILRLLPVIYKKRVEYRGRRIIKKRYRQRESYFKMLNTIQLAIKAGNYD